MRCWYEPESRGTIPLAGTPASFSTSVTMSSVPFSSQTRYPPRSRSVCSNGASDTTYRCPARSDPSYTRSVTTRPMDRDDPSPASANRSTACAPITSSSERPTSLVRIVTSHFDSSLMPSSPSARTMRRSSGSASQSSSTSMARSMGASAAQEPEVARCRRPAGESPRASWWFAARRCSMRGRSLRAICAGALGNARGAMLLETRPRGAHVRRGATGCYHCRHRTRSAHLERPCPGVFRARALVSRQGQG
jgi:hypothetical protein